MIASLDNKPIDYACQKVSQPIVIDGNLEKACWQKAKRSPRFVDMVTGHPGIFNTQAAALWDEKNLYFAFWAEEPFVSASLTERDSLIFLDNDLELFIDGGDCYYELEVNAFNAIYEVFFIWKDAYKKGGKFDVPEFDVHHEKAMTFAGDYDRTGNTFWKGRHPRGLRWAFLNYDMSGLKTAVKIDGKINDPYSIDKGWTLEISIPWQSLKWLANGRTLPPSEGDVWKIFFGRFQKLQVSGQEVSPHPAWVWSKHGVYDTHLPECFTGIQFSHDVLL